MTSYQTIDVQSENRLGITYEILSVFAELNIDLIGLEMQTYHTFLQYHSHETDLNTIQIKQKILQIPGVKKIVDIEFLPSEAKRLHLDALLSNLPDPLFDIDESGQILKVNHAAVETLGLNESEIYQRNITDFFSESIERLLHADNASIELTCMDTNYFAEIIPIISQYNEKKQVKGAVITLKRPERLGLTISSMQQNRFQGSTIVAQSNEMLDILAKAKRFSELELPILITGETGTGKEILAKSIHENSSRKQNPFLAINCAALPENLLESELFGYSSGAFSGALKSGKPGLFELANGGTLFLDEIGEMSPYLQAKLLRFLQDYTFRRLGSNKERTVDVRIISATHRKLNTLFKTNQFREDLYYRLNVLSIIIPPLRERKGDIKLLAQHFVKLAGIQVNRKNCSISEQAIKRLEAHHWPGNIRQLQNLIFRSVAISNSNLLGAEDLLFNTAKTQASNQSLANQSLESEITSLKQATEDFERNLLSKMMERYPSTRKLAERLDVSHNTVALKMKKYRLR
ncbi:sigma 54-interacting transcriptional regulator [Aliikangiella maris]|uniref:HTH-type transcriptional regulatory protein TyrR n=2 Tax=Aliikangiella maris TaxID=3162458 RepID=A0ABV2BWS8_9GAMM